MCSTRAFGFLPVVQVISGTVAAATLRVPADHATIQAALDAALPGDVVVVAEGEYGIIEPLSFKGKDVILRSESGPNRTTIVMTATPDRATRHSVVVFETNETPAAVLEGFTITGGKGTSIPPDSTRRGGGILCINGASPMIVGCHIEENEVIDEPNRSMGGGFAAEYGSNPVLRDCRITRNRACRGGGVAVGQGKVLLERCTISSNTVVRAQECYGGGILVNVSADVTLTECIVSSNFGQYGGGGVQLVRAVATISRCTFLGNSVDSNGGGIGSRPSSTLTVLNTVFAANKATGSGGAIHLQDTTALLMNCTFSQNLAGFEGPTVACQQIDQPLIRNCIFWINRGTGLCGDLEHCLTNLDPRFMNPGVFDLERTAEVSFPSGLQTLPDFVVEEPDFRIQPDSPALDAGSSDGAPGIDRDGKSRPCRDGIDLGAYELCESFRRGDVNTDGVLDISDGLCALDFLFSGYADLECLEAADSNNDGAIDCSDPIFVLGYLFLGTDPPPTPGPPPLPCGEDTDVPGSTGDLGCTSYAFCDAAVE